MIMNGKHIRVSIMVCLHIVYYSDIRLYRLRKTTGNAAEIQTGSLFSLRFRSLSLQTCFGSNIIEIRIYRLLDNREKRVIFQEFCSNKLTI